MSKDNKKDTMKLGIIEKCCSILLLLVGILSIMGIFVLLAIEELVVYSLFVIPFLVVMAIRAFYVGGMTLFLYTSSYSVDKHGITVCYMKKTFMQHSWNDITEISVADVFHPSKGGEGRLTIRVVIGTEKDGPTNKNCSKNIYGYEKWRKETYAWKHWKQVILLDYSIERYIEIKNASGKEIKDYRTFPGEAWKVKLPD